MKLICDAISLAVVKKNINNKHIAGFIIGLEDASFDMSKDFNIKDIIKIIKEIKKKEKKIIINVARLFHETELDKLKQDLQALPCEDIDFFMYSDFGVYQILLDMNYQNKTLLYAPTYLTNTQDVLAYQAINGSVVISNQISSNELIEIVNHTNSNKMVMGFGVATIFYSRRPLLTNYFKYRGENKNPYDKKYTLKEETRDDFYPIREFKHYTKIYDYKHYYLFEEFTFFQKQCEVIVSSQLLTTSTYNILINVLTNYLDEKDSIYDIQDDSLKKIKSLGIPLYKGAYGKQLILRKGENDE